jgi:hypothetical protein
MSAYVSQTLLEPEIDDSSFSSTAAESDGIRGVPGFTFTTGFFFGLSGICLT